MRYLLHLTARKNLPKILKNGLKAQKPTDPFEPMRGVFMTSTKDLKYWNNVVINRELSKQKGLLDLLIKCVKKNTNEIVALRIPINKLKAPIIIRNQSIILGDIRASKNLVTNEERIQLKKLYSNKDSYILEERRLRTKKRNDYTANGAPFSKAKSLREKKKAIEYVYQGDIPPEAIEYIGKASNITHKTPKEVFSELFAGQPEQYSLLTWA